MSDNEFLIKVYFRPGTLNRSDVLKVFKYPLKWGESLSPDDIKKFGDEELYFKKAVDNSFNDKKNSDFPMWVNYIWLDIFFRRDEVADIVVIEFHKGNLDPWDMLSTGKKKLDDVYLRAEQLIDYSIFIWELQSKKAIIAIGDSKWSFTTPISKGHGVSGLDFAPLKLTSRPSFFDFIGIFWLSIVPKDFIIPQKWALGVSSGHKKPDFKYLWYRKEKIKDGTLLIQSRLPWQYTGIPDERPWIELEKIWRELESKNKN